MDDHNMNLEPYYTSGFYKLEGEDLFCAPNSVTSPIVSLVKVEKDSYEYPQDGWYWFNSLNESCSFWDLDVNIYIEKEKDSDVI